MIDKLLHTTYVRCIQGVRQGDTFTKTATLAAIALLLVVIIVHIKLKNL